MEQLFSSTTMRSIPSLAAAMAQAMPEPPAPTTSRSASRDSVPVEAVFCGASFRSEGLPPAWRTQSSVAARTAMDERVAPVIVSTARDWFSTMASGSSVSARSDMKAVSSWSVTSMFSMASLENVA